MRLRPPSFALAVLALALVDAAAAAPRRAEARGCPAEIGVRAAGDLVRECRAVRAEAGACDPALSCLALRTQIRRGCEDAGAVGPPFCEFHVDLDEEEDE